MRLDPDRRLFTCGHCGNQEEAPATAAYLTLLTETSWNCPLCSTRLSTGQLEGYSLFCCPRCFGLLISMRHFTDVIAAARAHESRSRTALPRQQSPSDRSIACPSCGYSMDGHFYAGPGNVVIDSCERCELNWLDASELRRIAIAPDGVLDVDG
jgi:Zn-finger nucleic acid-binding protein